jgi:hypothetical protein
MFTQPSTDHHNSLMAFPNTLTTEHLSPLRPHVSYVLSTLVESQVFYILPSSQLHPHNPRELPREIFFQAGYDTAAPTYEQSANETLRLSERPKKKGRPSKRDKLQKAKDALKNLEKWLEKTNYVHPSPSASEAAGSTSATTHVLLSHPPTSTRYNYQAQKSSLLQTLASHPHPFNFPGSASASTTTATDGQKVLELANKAMVARLRRIDQMAAEKGLEVGGEGGERTGLERVERAAAELGSGGELGRRGGILGLLEGGGMGSTDMSDGDKRDYVI